MGEDTAWNVVEDARLEDLYAGEHQRSLIGAACVGHAAEAGDATLINVNDAEAFALAVSQSHERRDRVCFAVRFERVGQIDVGDDLAVDGEKSFVLKKLTRVVEGAARAEDNRLFNVS